jgi:hypothetical protein
VPAAKLTSLFAPPDVSEFRNSAFKGLSAPIDVAVIDPCHEEVPV